MQAAYILLMMIAGVLAVWRGSPAVLLCAAAVVYNWCINTAWVLALQNTDAVFVFLVSDVVSLALVLKFGDTSLLQQLAATYVGQIIMHFVKIAGDGDPYYYWLVLTGLGYAQLCLLILAALRSKLPVYRETRNGAR